MVFIFILTPSSEEIRFSDGRLVQAEIVQYHTDYFILSTGEKIERNQVKEISFMNESSGKEKTSEQQSSGREKYAEYFERAYDVLDKYPDAYGIILEDRGENILNPDGSRIYKYYFLGFVANEKAKVWGQKSVWEQKERYTSEILSARTITPDLEVINYDPDNIEIIKPESESWSYGDKDILKVFSIPGVDIGNLVEYSYVYNTHNPEHKDVFEPNFLFGDDIPVVKSSLLIGIPENKELNYFTRNMPSKFKKPKTFKKDGVKYYEWTVKDVSPYVEEPYMPDPGDIVPRVDASIFKDWDYLFKFQREMLLRRMQPSPEIEAKVKELTEGVENIEEKIAKIYYFVQKEIRYVSIKGSLGTGLSGHPASETFEKRYGDCVDKAVLLSTMLRVIGVEAYPVSVNTNDSDRAPVEIPCIYSNHAITEVHLDGRIFYLDSTSTFYRYPYFRADDQGIPVVNEIKGTIREIPVMPPEYNWNMYSLKIELNENGDASITETNNYQGEYESGLKDYYSYYSSDEMRTQIFQSMANEFAPGAEFEYYKMTTIDYETPFSMEYKFKVKKYPLIADDLFILNPKPKKLVFPEIVSQTRRYPIEYTTSQRTDNRVEMIIPENFSVRYLPPKFSYKDKYVEFNAEFIVEGNRITYSDTFKRFERIIPVKDYKKYREVLLTIQEYSADSVILQKNGGTGK